MPKIQLNDDLWEPPAELIEFLDKKKHPKFRQRDRVELIVAFYSLAHGGNAPTYEKIGEVLKISRSNAHRFAMELTMESERRAVKRNGKFWLINSQYSHPVIRERRFSAVVQES